MAITEDASTPAVVSGTGMGSITTASFSPPANTLLIALACGGSSQTGSGETTTTITDSTGGSWLRKTWAGSSSWPRGEVAVFYRYLSAAPGSMTVTASWAQNAQGRFLAVRVLNGANSSQTGASASAFQASNLEVSISTTTAGAWVYGVVDDPYGTQTFTAGSGNTIINSFGDTSDGLQIAAIKASAAVTTPGAFTFGVTNNGDGGYVACMEVLPSGEFGGGGGGTAASGVPVMRTWTDGEVVTAAEMNSNVRDPINFLISPPRCLLTTSAGATFSSNASPTVITQWDTPLVNTDGIWSSGNPQRMTANTPGLYEVQMYLHFPWVTVSGNTSYQCGITLNAGGTWSGSAALVEATGLGSADQNLGTSVNCVVVQYLNKGDYLEFYEAQDSGSNSSPIAGPFGLLASVRWIAST